MANGFSDFDAEGFGRVGGHGVLCFFYSTTNPFSRGYNHDMARRLRIALGVILLVISCVLVAWGVWPTIRERRVLSVNPANMTLPTPTPTPSSFIPDFMFGM